jgi:hypothetical protein
MGYCPAINCPCEHKDKKMKILDYSEWSTSEFIPKEVNAKYQCFASSILAFLCGGCHSLKSLQIEPNQKDVERAKTQLLTLLSQNQKESAMKLELILVNIKNLLTGETSIEKMHNEIQNNFPNLSNLSDRDCWDIFRNILMLIPDPERRANFHLRYMRWRPRIWTPCCNREHCFRCRTKDFHEGKTCDENVSFLDSTVIDCPSCGVYLVKGDGCNTITCVCSKQFSWSIEKENVERGANFARSNPIHTATTCVEVLVGDRVGSVADARAWQTRHSIEIRNAMIAWWLKKYGACPSQACTILTKKSSPTVNEGVQEVIDIWSTLHAKEVEVCKENNLKALRSIFETFHSSSEEQGRDAVQVMKQLSDNGSRPISDEALSPYIASAKLWISEHPIEYSRAISSLEQRLADQFLYLFGNHNPTISALCRINNPSTTSWNIDISNSSLSFSNNNTSVQRVGNVSSYPAAFADLPTSCDRSRMRVRVDLCPRGPNWLTVGLARRGLMPTASSDGFGRSSHTWGIHDDRSNTTVCAKVSACGQDVDTCRKFTQGDIITCIVDVSEVIDVLPYMCLCCNCFC